MDKHSMAGCVHHIQGLFLRIKSLSASGEIDNLCLDGIIRLNALTDSARIQKELDDVRSRMIDPMM
jgi:hypothetical protein